MARQKRDEAFDGPGRDGAGRGRAPAADGDAWVVLAGAVGVTLLTVAVAVGVVVASRSRPRPPAVGAVPVVVEEKPKPPEPPVPPPVDWAKVGPTASAGDVRVTGLYAAAGLVSGTRSGKPYIVRTGYLKVRLANLGKTRVVRYGGWVIDPTLADEHGNVFKAAPLPDGFRFTEMPAAPPGLDNKDVKESRISCHGETLEPGQAITFFLFFEKPARVSGEARVTLPADAVGGEGLLHIKLPVEFVGPGD